MKIREKFCDFQTPLVTVIDENEAFHEAAAEAASPCATLIASVASAVDE